MKLDRLIAFVGGIVILGLTIGEIVLQSFIRPCDPSETCFLAMFLLGGLFLGFAFLSWGSSWDEDEKFSLDEREGELNGD